MMTMTVKKGKEEDEWAMDFRWPFVQVGPGTTFMTRATQKVVTVAAVAAVVGLYGRGKSKTVVVMTDGKTRDLASLQSDLNSGRLIHLTKNDPEPDQEEEVADGLGPFTRAQADQLALWNQDGQDGGGIRARTKGSPPYGLDSLDPPISGRVYHTARKWLVAKGYVKKEGNQHLWTRLGLSEFLRKND